MNEAGGMRFDAREVAVHYLQYELGGRKYIDLINNPDIDDETEEEIIQECIALLTRAHDAGRDAELEQCIRSIRTYKKSRLCEPIVAKVKHDAKERRREREKPTT